MTAQDTQPEAGHKTALNLTDSLREVAWLELVQLEMRMRDGGIWSWMVEPVEVDPGLYAG